MSAQEREIRRLAGAMVMVGVRGASADDPALRADLAACAEAGCRAVILFDRDLPTDGPRNIVSPAQTVSLCAHLRDTLGPGAIIGVDHEGGSVARLAARLGFAEAPSAEALGRMPFAEALGAIEEHARTVAAAGCSVNFAPCVDLATNPDSPIISRRGRAFGADHLAVFRLAGAVVRAHARAAVRTCLKHFPGHGSARGDTHRGLEDISAASDRLRDLAPYRALVSEFGASPPFAVMTGHLVDQRIDPRLPASLSRAHTDGVLRRVFGFEGVVVTDSLDMGAITAGWPADEAVVLAVNAGADLVLDGVNTPGGPRPCPAPAMADAIVRAVMDGRIEGGVERLRRSVDRIARWIGG